MAKRTFTPLFTDAFEGLLRDVDRASETVGKRLDGIVVAGKPVPIVNGKELPQTVVFTDQKDAGDE